MQPATNTEQHYHFTHPERERESLSPCLTVSLCEECVTMRWKKVKKKEKIKERKERVRA